MEIAYKEGKIKEFLEKNGFIHITLNEIEINQIFTFYFDKVIVNDIDSSNVFLYFGVFYKIQGDFDNMKKYYLMAIDKVNVIAMTNLANNLRIKGEYEDMKKYYLMAIDKGDPLAMSGLGKYYESQKDYVNMMKYISMAIERGNENAIDFLNDFVVNNSLFIISSFKKNIKLKNKIDILEKKIIELEY